MKKTHSTDPMTDLQQQLRTLQEYVARLEKRLAAVEHRTDITCTSLKVVDANKKTVASIDKTGSFNGTTAVFSTPGQSTSVLINGTTGNVHCRSLTVYATKMNQSVIELKAIAPFQSRLRMRSEDAPKDGWCVELRANSKGGTVNVTDAKKPTIGRVSLESGGGGYLGVTGTLPNRKTRGVKIYSGLSPSQGGEIRTYYEDTVTANVPPRVSPKSKQLASKK